MTEKMINENASSQEAKKMEPERAKKRILNLDEIMRILPHRPPFLLIDRVTDYDPGEYAEAVKCVSMNEPYFTGHFPEYPVMPGVLIIEAMAQTGAVAILTMPEYKGGLVFFGGIRNARFRQQVRPGDVLTLKCGLVRRRGPVGIGRAEAFVGERLVAEAELTFAVSMPGQEDENKRE